MAAADGAGAPPSPALRHVALCGIPIESYVALRVHIDDLVREFEIIDLGHHSGAARVPREVHDAAEELARLFEQAEALARAGVLLTVPLDDDLSALRQWMVNELVRQLRTGAGPAPCPLG